jgi:5'(3')-deoxyribonucleotidase
MAVVPTREIGRAVAAQLPSDDFLMMLVSFNIPEYTTDNRRAWEHLHPLLFDTPAWEYVKHYNVMKDALNIFSHVKARTIKKYINTFVGAFND